MGLEPHIQFLIFAQICFGNTVSIGSIVKVARLMKKFCRSLAVFCQYSL